MKIFKLGLVLALTLAVNSPAYEARFFRLVGPVATTITAFTNGYVSWTNAPTNTIFTVQTTTSLSDTTNWVDYVQIPVTNGANTNRLIDLNPPAGMVLIPAGSFTMGDNLDGISEALPLHTVYVSAFYMDKYEVTKALWDSVKTWSAGYGYSFDYADSGLGKASTHPAHTMTWHDAVKWCNARSQKEGLTPCYYTDAGLTTIYKTGQVAPYVNWGANGYRLPTEAEWEKAARGGSGGQRFGWGNTITHSQANYYSSSYYDYDVSPTRGYHPTFNDGVDPYTSPAGYFAPNGYGLYDMAGNVWEWCWDWYSGTYYSSSPSSDPRGAAAGSYRVIRGGGWGGNAVYCWTAYRRFNSNPDSRVNFIGFRCARAAGQ